MKETISNRVVVIKDENQFTAMDQVLDKTDFFQVLEKHWKSSNKDISDFIIAIKPNIMMGYSQKDPYVITDPKLVEYLIDRIVERGFTNIAVVESQNVYGNWFRNRDVLTVSTFAGYTGKNYRIIDFTQEMVPYDFGNPLGMHWVGPTWRDADFRISFAKNKTHISCYNTLTIKNIYGCLPQQNKFKEYHKKLEFDWPTIEMLKHFPCHFGFIDAIYSADGLLGLKAGYSHKNTQTIIGGESIFAVEAVGALKMGLNPSQSRIYALAEKTFNLPKVDSIEWLGDKSIYKDWENVPRPIAELADIGEEFYNYSNLMGFVTSDMDSEFPLKLTAYRLKVVQFFRNLALWFQRKLFG